MNENNKNVDRLEELLREMKKYVELQTDLAKLEFTEKLSIIFSRAILVLVFAVLGLLILLNISFMMVYVLNNYLDDIILSYGIIGLIFLILSVIIYQKRDQLITQHVVNFLGRLFLDKNDNK